MAKDGFFCIFLIYLLVYKYIELFYLLSQQTSVNCSFAFSWKPFKNMPIWSHLALQNKR